MSRTRFASRFKWWREVGGRLYRSGGLFWGLLLVALGGVAVAIGLTSQALVKPYRWAVVSGGPSDGSGPVLLRAQLRSTEPIEDWGDSDLRPRLEVLTVGGSRWVSMLSLDRNGYASIIIPGDGTGLREVRVAEGERLLAHCELGRRRTAWEGPVLTEPDVRGSVQGPLTVMVEVVDGLLLLERPGKLSVLVRADASQAREARVRVLSDSLEFVAEPPPEVVDLRSPSSFAMEAVAFDPAGDLRLELWDESGTRTTWTGRVPVRMGGIHVARVPDGFLLTSPIPREEAYFMLLTRRSAQRVGRVALQESSGGLWQARLTVPEKDLLEPSWLMVGPEPELDGTTAIGWPVAGPRDALGARPSASLRVPVLVDGRALVEARVRVDRRRAQTKIISLGLALAVIILGIVGLGVRAFVSQRGTEEWRGDAPRTVLDPELYRIIVLGLLVLLGVLALVGWGLARVAG